MKPRDLSIVIPARNEMFLRKTVESILENIEANTEIIIILDGEWANPPIPNHERVTIVKTGESIGQRAATNMGTRLSKAKFVMKLDAHCTVAKGFDKQLIADCEPDMVMIPRMYNLHAFDWVCDVCDARRYQGPTPDKCWNKGGCPSKSFHRDIVWKPKPSPETDFMRFDKELKFQYWSEYKRRPENKGDIVDLMSSLGACRIMTRDLYWKLGGCDEGHGSWGQEGTEWACKAWLSGNRQVINKRTWFSHMFRTQGGDFGFPYKHENGAREKAHNYSKDLWLNNKWPGAIRPFQWILDKFYPIPDWHKQDTSKGIIYYTDNQLEQSLFEKVQKQLRKAVGEKPIVAVSLEPMEFSSQVQKSFVLGQQRGYLTMAKQILTALENSEARIIFFCEHDVLYHRSHFDFTPPKEDVYYYNTNVWKVRQSDGHAYRTDDMKQLSGLCAYRDILIKHFKERVKRLEEAQVSMSTEDFNRYVRAMGFEPGTHGREERIDDLKADNWESRRPNLDIRHDRNLTASRWSPDQFKNDKYTKGWQEAEHIPGWGVVKGRFKEILASI